jgi:hypothetical protein
VTGWSQLFLGVIALATLILAIVQVGVLIAAGLLARRVRRLLEQVERELQPAFAHVNSISRDAARAAAITVAQFERVDQVAADLKRRVDDAMTFVQSGLVAPVREGRAVMSALQAAVDVLRDARRRARTRQRADEEDALFI